MALTCAAPSLRRRSGDEPLSAASDRGCPSDLARIWHGKRTRSWSHCKIIMSPPR